MDLWLRIIILAILGYALGNWSMARMISWRTTRTSITTKGSGNPGTMNIVRTYGWKKGALVLILDVIKGAVPALAGNLLLEYGMDGKAFNPSVLGVYVGGAAVILGHVFPIVFKFKGGKGVACGIGVFLVADPILMIAVFFLGALILYVTEYGFIMSLFYILAMAVLQIVQICTGTRFINILGDPPLEMTKHVIASVVLICVMAVLIIIMHRENFARLFKGKENKTSLRKAFQERRAKKLAAKEKTVVK